MGERSSSAEIAWAAGIFEGEGSFTAHNVRKHYWAVGASIQMTDRDVLEKFFAIVRVGYIEDMPTEGRPAHWKPAFRWRVHDTQGVQTVIQLLLPWLCERRRARALEVDAIARTIVPGYVSWHEHSHCKNGHALTGDNVLYGGSRGGKRTRRCRECRRKYHRDRYRARVGSPPERWLVKDA